MRCTPQQLEKQMENSQIERAAVARVAAPTVPLKTLVECRDALMAIHALRCTEVVPVKVLVAVSVAAGQLDYYVNQLLAAQSVGVTA